MYGEVEIERIKTGQSQTRFLLARRRQARAALNRTLGRQHSSLARAGEVCLLGRQRHQSWPAWFGNVRCRFAS